MCPTEGDSSNAASNPNPATTLPGSFSGTRNLGGSGGAQKVQQPKPQALPSRSGPSSILVSPRQNGNPVLKCIKSMPWEYSDIPADFVLGATTCALFLSLKYHRVRPDYIYNRIRGLQGKYNLRIMLLLVDIDNHEATLKELTKTSLINNVTIVVCWSAQEAGHYLELYKTYEYAGPTSIRSGQTTSYSERLVEFITVPRGVNKTDAVSLVSNFGSIRTAINAQPDEIASIAGWGAKKVDRWCRAVREPFRLAKAAKRPLPRNDASAMVSEEPSHLFDERLEDAGNDAESTSQDGTAPLTGEITTSAAADSIPSGSLSATQVAESSHALMPSFAGTAGNKTIATEVHETPPQATTNPRKRPAEPEVSEGIMAALAKLRQDG